MMKEFNSMGLMIFCGLVMLGQCTYTAGHQVKSGLESVANALDRVARATK